MPPIEQRKRHRQQGIKGNQDQRGFLKYTNDIVEFQLLFLPSLPSCLASLLFLQHLCDPVVEKDKAAETMVGDFNYKHLTRYMIHAYKHTKCWAHPASWRPCGAWLSRCSWRSLQWPETTTEDRTETVTSRKIVALRLNASMGHTETIVTGFDFSFFTFTDVAQNATVTMQFDLQNLITSSQTRRGHLCEVKRRKSLKMSLRYCIHKNCPGVRT